MNVTQRIKNSSFQYKKGKIRYNHRNKTTTTTIQMRYERENGKRWEKWNRKTEIISWKTTTRIKLDKWIFIQIVRQHMLSPIILVSFCFAPFCRFRNHNETACLPADFNTKRTKKKIIETKTQKKRTNNNNNNKIGI